METKSLLEQLQEYKIKKMLYKFWEEFDKQLLDELLITGEGIIE